MGGVLAADARGSQSGAKGISLMRSGSDGADFVVIGRWIMTWEEVCR